jgi:hypothetical protein
MQTASAAGATLAAPGDGKVNVMKVIALTLAAAIAVASLATPAFSAGTGAGGAIVQTEDFSASKRKRAHAPAYTHYVDPVTGEVHSRYRPHYLVPSSDFDGGYYAGEYAYRRALGQCVEDLGYGRFKGC